MLGNPPSDTGKKIISATTSDELVLEVTNKIHGPLQIIDIMLVIPLDESIEPWDN